MDQPEDSVVQIDQLREMLASESKRRMVSAEQEILAVLKKYRCELSAKPVFVFDGRSFVVNVEIQIAPVDKL